MLLGKTILDTKTFLLNDIYIIVWEPFFGTRKVSQFRKTFLFPPFLLLEKVEQSQEAPIGNIETIPPPSCTK